MRKIPCMFQRFGNLGVTEEITPGCEWVSKGLGIATRKFDGVCCMFDAAGRLYKRYTLTVRLSDRHVGNAIGGVVHDNTMEYIVPTKPVPEGFTPIQDWDNFEDWKIGQIPGWIAVNSRLPENRWFKDALKNTPENGYEPGTYELCGPKVNGNPEELDKHTFLKHGSVVESGVPREYTELRNWLKLYPGEGVVWYFGADLKCKIRRKDFGVHHM